ncbi:MAG: EamA family transporter [Phycisphaerae bacterium]
MSKKWLLVIGLLLAVGLDTAVQLCWKAAVPQQATPAEVIFSTLSNPWFWAVPIMMLCQLFNWMGVLSIADVSLAQPITALGYVTVAVMSYFLWHETLTAVQMLGIGCILIGVLLVSRTHRSEANP